MSPFGRSLIVVLEVVGLIALLAAIALLPALALGADGRASDLAGRRQHRLVEIVGNSEA
jgi:hypothetical protein